MSMSSPIQSAWNLIHIWNQLQCSFTPAPHSTPSSRLSLKARKPANLKWPMLLWLIGIVCVSPRVNCSLDPLFIALRWPDHPLGLHSFNSIQEVVAGRWRSHLHKQNRPHASALYRGEWTQRRQSLPLCAEFPVCRGGVRIYLGFNCISTHDNYYLLCL